MEDVTKQVRTFLIEVLDLLASEKEQLCYERNVPHVDITAELLCKWFNDSYIPTSPVIQAGFTLEELALLAKFNEFYEARWKLLPKSQGTVRTWLAHPVWREIMEQAAQTRKQLPD